VISQAGGKTGATHVCPGAKREENGMTRTNRINRFTRAPKSGIQVEPPQDNHMNGKLRNASPLRFTNHVFAFCRRGVSFTAAASTSAGAGNGNPAWHEPDTFPAETVPEWSRSLFNGLAQITVQSTRDAGAIKLTANSGGLTPAPAVLESKPRASRPSVP